MSLKDLSNQVAVSFGLIHVSNVRTLRLYLSTTPIEQLEKELKEVKDATSLRAIWEAGVPKYLQAAYMKQLNDSGILLS